MASEMSSIKKNKKVDVIRLKERKKNKSNTKLKTQHKYKSFIVNMAIITKHCNKRMNDRMNEPV